MKRFTLFLFIASLVFSAYGKDYKYDTVANDPMGVRIYTLDNGLKVYLSVNKEKPRAEAHIAVNTGSKNDPADCTGLAHYLEHLMFKGSKQFGTTDYSAEKPYIDKITSLYEDYRTITDPAARKAKYHEIDSVSQIAARYNIPNEYDKLMSLIGSEGSNAFTGLDITCYTENVPSNELERWAKVQADRFQNLVMRGFHTELEAVYEEYNIGLANDSEKAYEALLAKMFPSHSYGTQTTIGTQDHLKNPSLVEIQKYYDRYYVPNNIAIVISGDIDPDWTIAMIDRYFGSWKPGKDVSGRQFAAQPVYTSPQETYVMGLEQENIILGWRFKGVADLQNDTLQVLSQILSNGNAGLIDLDINHKMALQEAAAELLQMKDYSALVLFAMPNEGQTLAEARKLLLAEIDKLKKGDFDDDLIESAVNNMKLDYLRQLDNNRNRVSTITYAFVHGLDWKQEVESLDRMAKISKADLIAFATKYLNDGYVYVEKRKGEDTSIKKIEKPAITPIPANREYASNFVKEMTAEKVNPIQPKFADYEKELTFSTTSKKLPVIYVHNNDNSLFTLAFKYDFGKQADNRYSIAASYLDLLGTSHMSAEAIKKEFYKLACYYDISVGDDETTITLSGLNENMPKALSLLNEMLNNATPDKEAYDQFVKQIITSRNDAKLSQRECFYRLWEYGLHGKRNSYTDVMSEADLKSASPVLFTSLLSNLKNIKHTVLYYGPSSEKELSAILAKNHTSAKKLVHAPVNKPYDWVSTPSTEICIAPYEAKNIYMRMLNQKQKYYDVNEDAVITLFNEYFGGGMNTIVFQELRETRGLAYNATANYITPAKAGDPEYMRLHIISQNDKMTDCIKVFKDITDNLPQNDAALEIAKQSIMKSIAANRVTKYNLIKSYLRLKKSGTDLNVNRMVYEKLPSLTMNDVVNFEKANVAGQPLHYYILGDEKELDMQSLRNIGPVKNISLEEIFGY